MKLELFFDTSKYVKISNPSFSIGGDIVIRGKTIDGEIKHIVAFDNSTYKLPKEKLQPLLDQFKAELNKYYKWEPSSRFFFIGLFNHSKHQFYSYPLSST